MNDELWRNLPSDERKRLKRGEIIERWVALLGITVSLATGVVAALTS